MIAILELTKSNVQQNIEQLQTPPMEVTINKKSTTTVCHSSKIYLFIDGLTLENGILKEVGSNVCLFGA